MACVIWNKDKTIKNEELVEKIFENESLTSEGIKTMKKIIEI